MFSYLTVAIAIALCLLGALIILGNFGALRAAGRNSSRAERKKHFIYIGYWGSFMVLGYLLHS